MRGRIRHKAARAARIVLMSTPTTVTPSEEPLIQPVCSVFRRFLKGHGLKFTAERARILDSVLSKLGVFEADELLHEMRQGGRRVSKATIYRTLKHLQDSKIITEILIDSKQAHYQLSIGRDPKGFLVCAETHEVIEFDAPELTAVRDRICREHGFEPASHRFVIYGVPKENGQEPVGDLSRS